MRRGHKRASQTTAPIFELWKLKGRQYTGMKIHLDTNTHKKNTKKSCPPWRRVTKQYTHEKTAKSDSWSSIHPFIYVPPQAGVISQEKFFSQIKRWYGFLPTRRELHASNWRVYGLSSYVSRNPVGRKICQYSLLNVRTIFLILDLIDSTRM